MENQPSRRSSFLLENFLQTQADDDFDDDTFETVWLRTRKAGLFRAFLNEFIKKHVYVSTANGWPSDAATLGEAVRSLALEIRTASRSARPPSWIFVACSHALEPREVLSHVANEYPSTPCIHCITSCQGVTTNAGFKATVAGQQGSRHAISLLTVNDPLGAYATIGMPPPDTPTAWENFEKTLDRAYLRLRESALKIMHDPANDDLEVPGPEPLAEHLYIWMSGCVGTEEKSLDCIYNWGHMRFKRTIPVVGGTGADDGIEGKWRAYCTAVDGKDYIFGQEHGSGVILTLIAASVKVFPCFMHPYMPMTECTAKVMSCGSTEDQDQSVTTGRCIHTLRDGDGKEVAAGTLYHQWCEDMIQKKLMPPPMQADGPGSFNPQVLAASSFCPLGVPVAHEGDSAYDYRMIHPSGIYWYKGQEETQQSAYLKNFASVETGTTDVVLFKAQRGDLLDRLSKLKEQLVMQIDRASDGSSSESVALSPDALQARVSGVLMVYCAGCMMAVNSGKDGSEQMRRLTASLSNCFAGRPFLAYHPFGEQGFFPSKQVNQHSNLMFSALVFSQDPAFEIDESRSFAEMLSPIIFRYDDVAKAALRGLLANGETADFEVLAAIIRRGMVRPHLLKDIAPCAARPILFALRAAEMFHMMARRYPLKAREYNATSTWFNDFCKDFINAAPLHLLAQSHTFECSTLLVAVVMAVKIDSKGLVATNHFQEVMEQVWTANPDPDVAIQQLLTETGGAISSHQVMFTPAVRHYLHLASYLAFVAVQIWTRSYHSDSVLLWSLVWLWSLSNLMQMLASPTTGYFTVITTLDDVILLFFHSVILYRVLLEEDIPRDLDALTMLLHFGNLLKGFTVHSKLGPLIIMVATMMGDILQFMALLASFLACFYFSLSSLLRGVPDVFIGEKWQGPSTLLVNAIWGPQVLWTTEHKDSGKTLFLSEVSGLDDSTAINVVGSIIVGLSVFCIPILLLNLLIAIMASTYTELSANVDSEFKRSFAACVMMARDLPCLPLPFSLPQDCMRVLSKASKILCLRKADQSSGARDLCIARCSQRDCHTYEAGSQARGDEDMDAVLRQQTAVEQMMAKWEASRSIERFKGMATIEHVTRMRGQVDALQDRNHVVYNELLSLAKRQERLEMQVSRALRELPPRPPEAGKPAPAARGRRGQSK